MTEANFKEGDVVVSKAGGPTMVVSSIGVEYDPSVVNCEWFDKNDRKFGSFKPATIKRLEQ